MFVCMHVYDFVSTFVSTWLDTCLPELIEKLPAYFYIFFFLYFLIVIVHVKASALKLELINVDIPFSFPTIYAIITQFYHSFTFFMYLVYRLSIELVIITFINVSS